MNSGCTYMPIDVSDKQVFFAIRNALKDPLLQTEISENNAVLDEEVNFIQYFFVLIFKFTLKKFTLKKFTFLNSLFLIRS